MIDEYVNKGKVAACTAWGLALVFLVSAWMVVLIEGHRTWHFAGMLAATGCLVGTFAAVLHIRCYAVRLACLVRASNSVAPPGGPRPVRDTH